MSSRKGITPVIAIVLLLMMTVAAAGMAYVWVTGVQQETQTSVGESLRQRTTQMAGEIKIDAVYESSNQTIVSVRNTGSATFASNVNVYRGATVCPTVNVNNPGASATSNCGAGSGLKDGVVIRAVPPQGAAVSVTCQMSPATETTENYCVM